LKVLKSRIFLAFLLFLIFLCLSGYLFFKNYYSIKSSIESDYSKRLREISEILAKNTDYVTLLHVLERKEEGQFLLLPEWLDIRDKMGLSNIIILDKDGREVFSLVESVPLPGTRKKRFEAIAPIISPRGDTVGFIRTIATPTFLTSFYSLRNKLLLFSFLIFIIFALMFVFMSILEKEHYRLKERLNRATVYLTASRLAGALAHEIKNPLFVIRGNLQLLRAKSPDKRYIESLLEEIDRINQIVLKYEKFGEDEERVESADLSLAVERIKDLMDDRLRKRGNALEVEIKDKIVLNMPQGVLQQILFNLILNAYEAIERRGKIRVIGSQGKNHVVIEVIDNGKGIKKADLKHVFEPFYSKKSGGTGLGLFVVKQLVEEFGGMISIYSKEGKGTRVVLKFRRKK